MMFKNSRINLKLILLIVVLSLGLFFLGRTLFAQYRVEGPLLEKINAMEGVKNVNLVDEDKLVINLDREISLKETYLQIEDIISQQTDLSSYQISLTGNESEELTQVNQELDFIIYSGIAGHRYQWMNEEIKNWEEMNFTGEIKLEIGEDMIFLTIRNDEYHLNRLYERQGKISDQVMELYGGEIDG